MATLQAARGLLSVRKQDTVMVSWRLKDSLLCCKSKGLSQGDLQPCLSSWWFEQFVAGKAAGPSYVELEFKLESQH